MLSHRRVHSTDGRDDNREGGALYDEAYGPSGSFKAPEDLLYSRKRGPITEWVDDDGYLLRKISKDNKGKVTYYYERYDITGAEACKSGGWWVQVRRPQSRTSIKPIERIELDSNRNL